MAYWFRKGRKGQVYICVMRDGKPKPLPRSKTRYLDGAPDNNIEAAVTAAEMKYEGKTLLPENLLVGNPKLSEQLKEYVAFLRGLRRDANTVSWHEKSLRELVFPFFLEGDSPMEDPSFWPGKAIKFTPWLKDKGVTYSNAFRAVSACRGFYKYLTDEGQIQTGLDLRIRNPLRDDDESDASEMTPLKRAVTPAEILAFVKGSRDREIQLMALCGYFFSLRPQELFALRPTDFRPGKAAMKFEASFAMKRADLFERMVLNVDRQLKRSGKGTKAPKAHSRGAVCCFDEDAAKLLVGLLKDADPQANLFSFASRHNYRQWRLLGISGVTLKDLRRASIYWLGHHSSLEVGNLQKHARHAHLATTQLYMRRPGEQIATGEVVWDLGA